VALCQRTWSWSPDGLEISFHDRSPSMGLAYNPGSGATNGRRRVSLCVVLLETFDAASIARVVYHELCHHYREEHWPRPASRWHDQHDRQFCEALSQVDPIVAASPDRCSRFADDQDPALANEAQLKRAARGVQPTWSPDAGTLEVVHLKSGRYSIVWAPRPGFRWTKYVRPLNTEQFTEILDRFSPDTWAQVLVLHRGYGSGAGLMAVHSLWDLAQWLYNFYPRSREKLAVYLARRIP
jgi:hypothetical protein